MDFGFVVASGFVPSEEWRFVSGVFVPRLLLGKLSALLRVLRKAFSCLTVQMFRRMQKPDRCRSGIDTCLVTRILGEKREKRNSRLKRL